MKRNLVFVILCFFVCYEGLAQKHKPDHLTVAHTTLHSAFPFASFGKMFTEDYHPGFEVGTGFNRRTRQKHDWFQAFQFGYSYHRFIQHSLALYSELGYRYKFFKTFAGEAKIGLGYLHAIPVGKIYKLSGEGIYKKKGNWGRPQVMAGFGLRLNKQFAKSGLGAFIQYQQRVQFPFIKSYVPLLPSNVLMAGIKIPMKSNPVPDKQ